MKLHPPANGSEVPEPGLTRRDALAIGSGAAATAFLPGPASAVSRRTSSARPIARDEAAYAGDLPPLPANWPKELPPRAPTVQRSLLSDPTILPEYRVVGCPMFACTQGNIGYVQGWYYAFAAPRSGTMSSRPRGRAPTPCRC